MPLAALSLPKSEKEALAMGKHTIDMRRCASCGHIYNAAFDQGQIQYQNDSTLVFNQGSAWIDHQRTLADNWIQEFGLAGKRVIEIGCGDGSFLEYFLKVGCDCIGFEPGRDSETAIQRKLKIFKKNFELAALEETKPQALICRHVIEHLSHPLEFLKSISKRCLELRMTPLFLSEVPIIEKALEQNRIADFFYEHASHFTEESFRTLFDCAGFEVLNVSRRYGDEVITLSARPSQRPSTPRKSNPTFQEASEAFHSNVSKQIASVKQKVAEWERSGTRVALWGAAGKGAAFMNMLGLTKDKFPVVVDSDPKKFGLFVPGTAQQIHNPSFLKNKSVGGILITTNWRARDIETEIRTKLRLRVPLYVLIKEGIVELSSTLKI